VYKPILDLPRGSLKSPRHSIMVWPYALGQYRIHLMDDRPDGYAPPGHGMIVREL
jgi:hypothetical protein